MRKTEHTDNSGERRRRGVEEVETVVGVREVGNCSNDHVCVSRVGLQQHSAAKD